MKNFKLDKAFEKARAIADLLAFSKRISGVAITGSVARNERTVHDVDLVLFHRGNTKDGVCHSNGESSNRVPSLLKKHLRNEGLCGRILDVLDTLPASFIFVHEKILTDCQYLQSKIPEKNDKGGRRDFFPTVFYEIPLVLMSPGGVRGALVSYVRRLTLDDPERSVLSIGHRCGNTACRPLRPWPEIQKLLKERKRKKRARAVPAMNDLHGGDDYGSY